MGTGHDIAGPPETVEALDRDLAYLGERYPSLEIRREKRRAVAIGPVAILLPDGSLDETLVRIEFSERYPRSAPRTYDEGARWTPDPDRHIESSRHFCLFLREADEPDMRGPDGIAMYLDEFESFLRQQLILDAQRKHNPLARFPGPEWPHGHEAYLLFCIDLLRQEPNELRERLWTFHGNADEPCFCGSGAMYGECHREKKLRLIRSGRQGGVLQLSYQELMELASG